MHKIIESENVTVDDNKPRRIQIPKSVDVEEIDDEDIDDKEKEESSQEEDVFEEEDEEKIEKEESHENENKDSPRSNTKTPSRWVQKNHHEIQIIGDKYSRVKQEEKYYMMKNKHYF